MYTELKLSIFYIFLLRELFSITSKVPIDVVFNQRIEDFSTFLTVKIGDAMSNALQVIGKVPIRDGGGLNAT
jgi:hypothetical protein